MVTGAFSPSGARSAGHDAIVVHVHSDGSQPLLGHAIALRLRKLFDVEYVTVQIEGATEVEMDPQ